MSLFKKIMSLKALQRFKVDDRGTFIVLSGIILLLLFITLIVEGVWYISNSIESYQTEKAAEQHRQEVAAENIEKQNTPKPMIKLITDLSGIVQWTWITVEYEVENASWVYFQYGSVYPVSGTNYYSHGINLLSPETSIIIKAQNKYREDTQTFTVRREKTVQEIKEEAEKVRLQKEEEKAKIKKEKEAEAARIAEEKYKKSPEYKKKVMEEKVNNLSDWDKWDIVFLCQKHVKDLLLSPSSADFPRGYDDSVYVANQRWWLSFISYLEAENVYWVVLKRWYHCTLDRDGENRIYNDVELGE